MTETNVDICAGDVSLSATLVVPAASKAAVIFVHGSGPQDRNQNSFSTKLNIFNTLADNLAQNGVASLRYDKRGVGASTGNYELLGQADLVADVCACIAWIQARGLGPVYLCGHSEGTAIAVAAAERMEVAGLVLLCPYVTDGVDILQWQAEQTQAVINAMTGFQGFMARAAERLLGSPLQLQRKMIKRVLGCSDDFVRVAGKRIPARWMRDFLTSDVAVLHQRNQRPTLVLVAERDCQCPPMDGDTIAESNANATLVALDNLSHLLRATNLDGVGDYSRQLTQPMDIRVTDHVCAWINNTIGSGSWT